MTTLINKPISGPSPSSTSRPFPPLPSGPRPIYYRPLTALHWRLRATCMLTRWESPILISEKSSQDSQLTPIATPTDQNRARAIKLDLDQIK